MRVMIDTNILISIFLFPSSVMQKLVDALTIQHTIVLPSYVIDELKRTIKRKFSEKYQMLDAFLLELPYEYTYTAGKIDINKSGHGVTSCIITFPGEGSQKAVED